MYSLKRALNYSDFLVEKTSEIMDLKSRLFDFINLSERQLENFINFLSSFRSTDLEKVIKLSKLNQSVFL